MFTTSGWDVLLLTVRTTPEGVELRVGAVFVLALVWIAYKAVGWWEDDESGPKITA